VPAELRAAATVLVLRDGAMGPEVFMVRRHDRSAFMGGAHVFPGGAVDAADRDAADSQWCDGIEHAAAQIPTLEPAAALALHVAAARELFEEAGVLLARDAQGRFARLDDESSHARFKQYRQDIHASTRTLRDVLEREQLRLAADALTVCAHWVTPPLDVRRFDTRFFAARLPIDQHPAHDQRETTESRWTTAGDAIAAAKRGDIVLPSPTWVTLRELEPFQTVDAIMSWQRGREIPRREPTLVEQDGVRALLMPVDPSYDRDGSLERLETRFVWTGDRWLPPKTG